MEGIVKKPQYKIMHVIFNQCIRLNFSKALFTVFLFTIIETLLSMIPLSVAMNSASAPENAATAGSSSVLSVLFSFVLTLALCIVLFMMLYGMFCVTARMVQKQKVTVGWLFIALIKKDKKVLGASAIFTLYYTVLGFLAEYLFSYLTDKNIIPAGLGSGSLSSVMYFFAFAALVFVLAFIPFSFVHLILYYFKNAKVLGSFALSVRILWGQTLHFLGFVFYAAGTSLISLALLSAVLFLIPQNLGTSLGIFTMFLSILRLFEYYKVLSRILIAIPVYFFFTVGAIKLCRPEQASTADGEESASLNEDSADLSSENPAGETSAQGKKMKVLIEGTTPCAELNIKNSRFIAEAFTVHDSLEAREKLHEQKKRYSDATHVCHAFVCGKDGGINGMSDDGEPGGTAGRPMLDVLKGSGITDILVTVTRYFGGTLLGTGGLVHAYSDSVKAVLEACQTEELVEKSSFTFSVEYPLYEIAMRFLSSFHTDSIKEDFASQVLISGCIWASETSSLEDGIRNLSKGKSQVQFSQ